MGWHSGKVIQERVLPNFGRGNLETKNLTRIFLIKIKVPGMHKALSSRPSREKPRERSCGLQLARPQGQSYTSLLEGILPGTPDAGCRAIELFCPAGIQSCFGPISSLYSHFLLWNGNVYSVSLYTDICNLFLIMVHSQEFA